MSQEHEKDLTRTSGWRAAERQHAASELTGIAEEVAVHDGASALLLQRVADSVRKGDEEGTKAYSAAVDARAIAELITGKRSPIWGVLELVRNVLVFAPIAVTWYGLALATAAYSTVLAAKPELITRPFLLLWQESFDGSAGVITFSTMAITDATLIAILIGLSMFIHFRSDVQDPVVRSRVALKESEIRSAVGHAISLASAPALGERQSDELLDHMVAEQRRIYERAMEREQQLFDLESATKELREAASALARVAEALSDKVPAGRR